jgi:hypothetical protein
MVFRVRRDQLEHDHRFRLPRLDLNVAGFAGEGGAVADLELAEDRRVRAGG